MNKKALELPVTVIVLLIISIVIFGFALYFIAKIRTGVKTIQTGIEQQAQAEIERLVKEENAVVAIPFNTKAAKIGQTANFGLGIKNILGEDIDFGAVVTFDGAYTYDGKELLLGFDKGFIETNWLGSFKEIPLTQVRATDYKAIPMYVTTGTRISDIASTKKGLYVFNVCVYCKGPLPECQHDITPADCSIGTGVEDKLYTGKIYQVNVEVK